MDEYTPDTNWVREEYASQEAIGIDPEKLAEFDRWLQGELAKAWDEGYYRGVRDNEFEMEPADNPYRKEP